MNNKKYSLRSNQSSGGIQDSGGSFDFFQKSPMHTLEQSKKRGIYTDSIKGDRLVTEEEQSSFKPISLERDSGDWGLMEKRMKTMEEHSKGQFGLFETQNKTENQKYQLFMTKVQPLGSDRSLNTSLKDKGLSDVNDGSHGFPLSLSLNPSNVDKVPYIFPESFMVNQGGARVMEEQAKDLFKKPMPRGRQQDVYFITETRTKGGDQVPNQVRRASLSVERDTRKNTIESMTVYGMSGHNNDQSFTRPKY